MKLPSRFVAAVFVSLLSGCITVRMAAPVPQAIKDATIFLDPTVRSAGADLLCPEGFNSRLRDSLQSALVRSGYQMASSGDHPRQFVLKLERIASARAEAATLTVQDEATIVDELHAKIGTACADPDELAQQLVDGLSNSMRFKDAALAVTPLDHKDLPQARALNLKTASSMLVLDLKSVGELPAHVAPLVTKLLLANLDRVTGLKTVSPDDIAAMLDAEKQKDLVGCQSTLCYAEIGGALGTNLVLYGDIGKLGSQYSVNLVVVDTKHAQVVGRIGSLVEANDDLLARRVPIVTAEVIERLNAPVAN